MSELNNFKCPNCGGTVEFDSKSQKLKCTSCDGVFELDTFKEDEGYTIHNEKFDTDDLAVYTCDHCGGTIMVEKTTAASKCPYCDSPVVMKGNVAGDYKPSRVIPFKLDKKAAKEAFKQHLAKKVLLPKAFKTSAVIDEIKGIYVPFWLFSGNGNARMFFDATKVRHYSDANYDYRETSYYKLFRAGNVDFSNVPVDGSSKMDDTLMQSIEPFNDTELADFNSGYLSGYVADKYDQDADEVANVANQRIANSTKELLSATTGAYTTVVPTSAHVSISHGQQEYVMLPVWTLKVKYNNQDYTFAMNGQTGKFVGNLPCDVGKLITIALLTFVTSGALIALIQYLMIMRG